MIQIRNLTLAPLSASMVMVLVLLIAAVQSSSVFADDCDHWGRLVHTGGQPGDTYCLALSGNGGAVTRQLEDKRDYDYFLLYLGYDDETAINESYTVELTNTQLTRPKIVVGTFYDDAPAGDDLTGTDIWYDEYRGSLGGMTLDEFKKMVTLAPNLQHDGVYDYVNGEIVVVQESSGAATRQLFYRVPVGTNLATNTRGERTLRFTPLDRGAYLIMVSNYDPSKRRGTLTGSYTLNISQD